MGKVQRIYQFDRNGNEIANYPNIKVASMQTGVGIPGISRCCNGKRRVAGGYVWSFHGQSPDFENVKKPIVQYDVLGNYIATYNTVREILDNNEDFTHLGVRNCLNGKITHYHYYIWLYEDQVDQLEKRMYEYRKQILSISLDKETREEYYSIQDACEKTGVERLLIARALREKATCNGCVWFRYYDQESIQAFENEELPLTVFRRLSKIEVVKDDGTKKDCKSIQEAADFLKVNPHTVYLVLNKKQTKHPVDFKVYKKEKLIETE